MAQIPVISSIISPEYLAEFVIDRYGFDGNTKCQVLKTGINHSYLIITPDNKFVLRIYYRNWRTESEIDEEIKLLEYLKANHISVSHPIKDIIGNYIQKIDAVEGERFIVLFSFAEGQSIRTPSEQICHSLGELMARIHQLTVNRTVERTTYTSTTLVSWALELAKDHFTTSSPEMQYFARASSRITAEFDSADQNELRYGTVHLDLWYENMKVRDETEITIFDFDNCGNGWLFLDIAYSLMLLFKNEPDKRNYNQKKESLLRGYKSINAISMEEERLLPYGGLAIWLHYTGVHVQRFDDFSNQFLSEEFLKYWIHTVDQWMEFNGIEI